MLTAARSVSICQKMYDRAYRKAGRSIRPASRLAQDETLL